jgi:8-oxo-dGTP pyrophosphatase MutT (NUDIX family)
VATADAAWIISGMPTPPFVLELRRKVGHDLLWLATAMGAVLDGGGNVLLGRRADNGAWTLPGGIIDPAEQPADAAVREIFEETGVIAVPDSLTSITTSAPLTYPNGDQVQYLEFCFRCRAVGGTARVNDAELAEVGWYAVDALPDLVGHHLSVLNVAREHRAGADFVFSGLQAVLGLGR